MPHVIVKLWPGRSEQQKAQLSKEIVADVMAVLSSGDEWISVAIEEIEPEDWVEQV
jgi:4-oxalocrotonate tautomerase